MKKLLSLLVVLLLVSAAGLAWWANQPLATTAYEFQIKPGSSLRSSAQQIAAAGVPLQPLLFELLARSRGMGNKLKAGAFEAQAGITPSGLLDKIVRGEFSQFNFIILEGWNFRQLRQAIWQNPYLQHDTANLSEQEILSPLTSDFTRAEGLFFPDTYLLPKGSSDRDVYKQAFMQLQQHLQTVWDQRPVGVTPLKTPYEALILASLIEKETGQKADRRMIAGVFVNRLKKGMLLQTDPTIIYGMGERYEGKIHKQDLQSDNAYNTYTRSGLPPTPIAMPGMESLLAALNPAPTDALYFVARGDGSSQFSATLDDHNHAVHHFVVKKIHKPK